MTITILAWEDGKSVRARWDKREIIVPEFSTLFAKIQERRGVVSTTRLTNGVWSIVVDIVVAHDILNDIFHEATEIGKDEASPIVNADESTLVG